MILKLNQLKSELTYSILNAIPHQYPYIHYIYNDLMSEASYKGLIEAWPDQDEFKSYDEVFGRPNSIYTYPNRRAIDMCNPE